MSVKVWKATLANRAGSTRDKYLFFFEGFVKATGLTPDQLREMKYQENLTAKPWERSQVENLLRKHLQEMEEAEYSCNTRKLAYNAVKSFFAANGMRLNLDRNDKPSGCAFGSKTPNEEEIRQIVNATEYLRNRVLILFLKDSGLRESDVVKPRWKDLEDYGEGFMGFTIETEKKKVKARSFIGPETTEVLRLYKEKRLKGTLKIPPEQNIGEHPVFALLTDPTKPMQPAVVSQEIGHIISLTGLEGVTGHGLRKFWEQNSKYEKLAYAKQMNGRALTDVERSYFWKETPELLAMYKANYRNLMINREDFRDVEDRLRSDYEREIKLLKDRIFELERKNTEQKKQLNNYMLTSGQVSELLRRIERLEKQAQRT